MGGGLGYVLERFVFRPLDRQGARTSEKLVATLGVFTLLLGAAYAIWTGKVRQGPRRGLRASSTAAQRMRAIAGRST